VAGSWVVQAVIPLENMAPSAVTEGYVINPEERRVAEARLEEAGLAPVGFYHSHPDHEVYFSRTDLEHSEEFQFGQPWLPPTYAYLVISVKKGKMQEIGAFIVKEGQSEKMPVQVKPGEGEGECPSK
jgi:proteasome lid subunit RPN8/RPN11